MPLECAILERSPQPREICPHCGDYPFEALERGRYQREKHDSYGKRQNYCLVICSACCQAVGYESPPWNSKAWKQVNAADQLKRDTDIIWMIRAWAFTVVIGVLLLAGCLALSV